MVHGLTTVTFFLFFIFYFYIICSLFLRYKK